MKQTLIISGRLFSDELIHHLNTLFEQQPAPLANELVSTRGLRSTGLALAQRPLGDQ